MGDPIRQLQSDCSRNQHTREKLIGNILQGTVYCLREYPPSNRNEMEAIKKLKGIYHNTIQTQIPKAAFLL